MASPLQHLRGILILLPWLAWLFAVDVAVSLLLPLSPLLPNLTYDVSSALAGSVWRWIQAVFTGLNGADIEVSGDALPAGESAVVVANHVGWADFYMIQALAIRAGMLGRCRYFAKVQLRWVPFLGWGLWGLGMPMVSRRWDRDRRELDRVFGGIVRRGWPTWLVSFSEATRFSPQKHAESTAWTAANGRPQPGPHLLYPRTKGFVTTVQHLRAAPHVAAVYDLAIAYQRNGPAPGPGPGSDGKVQFQTPPEFWDTLAVPALSRRGPGGYRFHVHARRFPLAELPAGDEALARWLEQRWVDKGRWLEELRERWAGEAKDR